MIAVKRLTRTLSISVAPVIIIVTLSQPEVDHYIDAGTGSLIIQAVVGGLFAGLVALKIFWSRIKTFFSNLSSRGKRDEGTDVR
ncbi:MAG: hypothetical protein A2Z74_02020 [Chloroflexi bacterium RBG_13_46_9]|nr:MAG: hypothetical protein A2Z74_02020 [Chloroflexi bacterium RBG_13_46_9]